jgi:hypothetical protein
VFEIRYYHDDDRDPKLDDAIAVVRHARCLPVIGHGVTLATRDGQPPRRYRIVDVDQGYTAQSRNNTYAEDTVAAYVIEPDDPRRLGK